MRMKEKNILYLTAPKYMSANQLMQLAYERLDELHPTVKVEKPYKVRICDTPARRTMDGEESAKRFLDVLIHKSGVADAVLYSFATGPLTTPKLEKLHEKSIEAEAAFRRLREDARNYFSLHPSEGFVECPICGSKYNAEYLAISNLEIYRCPLCRTDLRPDGANKEVDDAYKTMRNAQDAHAKEYNRLHEENIETCWLLRYEYDVPDETERRQ